MRLYNQYGQITQAFGGNANSYYLTHGLKGHTGTDFHQGYGKTTGCASDSYVYKVINDLDPKKYSGVFTLLEDGDYAYEVQYGHLKDIWVAEGNFLVAGQPLGTEGNRGDVYSLGLPVTEEQRKQGRGSHLHFQVRQCLKTLGQSPQRQYLSYGQGLYKDEGGYYYEVVNFENGYHGCIDPAPYLKNPTLWERIQMVINALKNLQKVGN